MAFDYTRRVFCACENLAKLTAQTRSYSSLTLNLLPANWKSYYAYYYSQQPIQTKADRQNEQVRVIGRSQIPQTERRKYEKLIKQLKQDVKEIKDELNEIKSRRVSSSVRDDFETKLVQLNEGWLSRSITPGGNVWKLLDFSKTKKMKM